MRLVAWIGRNDLNAAQGTNDKPSAIFSTIEEIAFDELHLLYNYSDTDVQVFITWLEQKTKANIKTYRAELSSPVDFHDIYIAADKLLTQLFSSKNERTAILINPGTSAMQAVWILLGKTKYQTIFYQSTKEKGVEVVDVPFEISAEFVPKQDRHLTQIATGKVQANAAFNDIITQNPLMQSLKRQATVLAAREVPVLIYGETGTGKELFATAIHNASRRSEEKFLPINCGAIPNELIDSYFFGHVKGAFTGALSNHQGFFEQADKGTLFLDEFGELPALVQVRLLRVLQSGDITPVGGKISKKVDVRIIAATNRDLLTEVNEGRFREDLFYRIAVGILKLPPLRQRQGDITLIAESLLERIYKDIPHSEHKELSPDAMNFILTEPWRGNIRELQSTLLRASLCSDENKISASDIKQSLFSTHDVGSENILNRDLSMGIDINKILDEVKNHYFSKAMLATGHNKTRAAKLLGLSNYQLLDRWAAKLDGTGKS